MAMQWLSMPAQPIKCILVTLQDLEHNIRTSFGTSESSMYKDSPIPFQSILQCKGSGPTIYIAVSAPLIKIIRVSGHGIKFESPLSQDKDSLFIFALVDNIYIVEGD